MAQFGIDDENFRTIVSKGILESLSAESKTLMINEAVQYLLTERPNTSARFNEPKTLPSPLTEAFREAVRGVAKDVVTEYITEEQVRALIAAGVRKQVEDLLNEEGAWLIDAVGYAVGQAITVRRKD